MKKTVPLVLGMMAGFYALAEFYLPHWGVRWLTVELQSASGDHTLWWKGAEVVY